VTDATLATLTPSSSIIEKTAAIPKVGQQLNSITKAITDTTSSINSLAASNASESEKRGIDSLDHPVEKRQVDTVTVLLTLIIVEIFATIAGAIAILGLAALLIYINPLTGAIAALILAVQLLLNVVLASVTLLLNTLLAGLALTIGGL
jgi:lysozyme family protein